MSSPTFGIEPKELEKIVSYYKSRTSELEDLKYFNENKIPELLTKLKTDPERGISSKENREEFFGSNKIFLDPLPNFCKFVWGAMSDLMIRILIVAAIVSIVLGCTISQNKKKDWIDGVSIVIAIFIVVLVSSITQYSKEKKFQELNIAKNEKTIYKLIRKGQPENHISDDILVGDLIIINYGDVICADILLIEGNGIKMDESALTGESDLMKKETYEKCVEISQNKKNNKNDCPSPLILSGTHCIEGTGKGIIIAVGEYSQKGNILRAVGNAKEDNKTPLEIKLDKIARRIWYIGLAMGIITFVVYFIRYMEEFSKDYKTYKDEKKKKNSNLIVTDPRKSIAKDLLNIIMISVSVIVVVVPEGLPLAVTLSLAFSINKLMAFNNLVRKMHACETMGGANYICTDKTGTITKNEMSVFQILTGKTTFGLVQNKEMENVGDINIDNNKYDFFKQIREDYSSKFQNENYWNLIKTSIALNVECAIKKLEEPNVNGDMEICETKNKTDKPFIDFLYRFKSPISKEREIYLDEENSYKQFPFDSQKKRMTTFIHSNNFPTGYRLFTKGGGDLALQYCQSYIDPDTGEEVRIDEAISSYINNKLNEFHKNRLRSLYIAYKDISEEEYNNAEKANDQGKFIDQFNLVFLCIFGIRDSLRDGVKEAVIKCNEASVNIIMVTGDNIVTATSIAKDSGILGDEIDLKNLESNDIEQNPEKMYDNNEIKRDEYIQKLLEDRPYSLTGNSFYTIIGGLYCDNCKLDSNLCKCPKTENEAKIYAEKTNTPIKKIKQDKIRDMDRFMKITTRLKVMARSQPIHKYALVLGLKALDNVVAVTGDGTNDAPALSKSDVGFAMFAGTDIAKEASDIIILDNNFSSIIIAIIYGRNIYDNIRKFLQFQLSVNFCACILVFICACIGNETPLTPVQMLWVNLIMDSLGSLALATEPPYDKLLKREPTKKHEFIINGKMCKHILIQSIVLIVLLIVLYSIAPKFIKEDNLVRLAENKLIKYCYNGYPGESVEYIISGMESKWRNDIKLNSSLNETDCGEYSKRQTLSLAYELYLELNSGTAHMAIIFNIFVFYTLFNQINCRIIDDSYNIFKRIGKNIFFIIIMIIEIGLQILMIFKGSSFFHVVDKGLTGTQWGICIGFSAITFFVSIIVKSIPLDVIIDKYIIKKEKQKIYDPIAPQLTSGEGIKVSVKIDGGNEITNGAEDEEDIISEKVNLNMIRYDFNNVGKGKLIDKISSQSNISKDHETDVEKDNNHNSIEKDNDNNNNIENNENGNEKEIENKTEEISKKYKITYLGQNLMNLPENYSTDDEDEFKFISLLNEGNDDYELAVDSKTIKIYAKMVSRKSLYTSFLFIF